MSTECRKPGETRRDPDFIGAEAAMRRAAKRARQRAAEVASAATTAEQTAENSSTDVAVERAEAKSGEIGTTKVGYDPRKLSFSQAQGHEEIPTPLNLQELPNSARTRIWNVLYDSLQHSYSWHSYFEKGYDWQEVLHDKHTLHDILPLDEWDSFESSKKKLRRDIENLPFNKVFDSIQYILRHPQCPADIIGSMKRTFAECRLAYTLDTEDPPTIFPSVTAEEGNAIVSALRTLRQTGLNASATHLRNASECINQADWADSVRESIHAVESVARQLDPKCAGTLGPALASIEQRGGLHPALKKAFNKLYGYTSSTQGIRHALLDRDAAEVGMDEAVFMLGACASFASYLSRKHAALNENGAGNGS